MTNCPLRAHIDALALRAALGTHEWLPPRPLVDPINGWGLGHRSGDGSVIVSIHEVSNQPLWIHASMTRRGRCPSYEDLTQLHRAAFGTGWAYQVFAPPEHHINHHEYALHLWGRLDGAPVLPDFAQEGTI